MGDEGPTIAVTPSSQHVIPHKIRVIHIIFMLVEIEPQPFHDRAWLPVGKPILKEVRWRQVNRGIHCRKIVRVVHEEVSWNMKHNHSLMVLIWTARGPPLRYEL